MNSFAGNEKKCPICKKSFIKTEEWVFKRFVSSREKFFCSWGCMRAWEKNRGRKIDRRERVIQAIKDGLSNREIKELLEEDYTVIDYWRKKLEEEGDG